MTSTQNRAASEANRSLGIAVILGWVVLAILLERQRFTCDDAFISFRYARHWVAGHGLVFNAGESPRVEGYSNFLWVVWAAIGALFHADPGVWANTLSAACAAALVALVARFAQRRLDLGFAGVLATALFTAVLPPITLWATSGLETMPFALAVFATFACLAQDPLRPRPVAAGVCALLTVLLRADGALWAGLVLVAAAIEGSARGGRLGTLVRLLLPAIAIVVIGTLAHAIWRHGYYGEWLPNTARVKAGFSGLRFERGLLYAGAMMLAIPVLLIVPIAALAVRARAGLQLALACSFYVIAAFLYAIDIGGDFMPMGRFVVAAMPFEALLFAIAWKKLAGEGQRARSAAHAFAIVMIAIAPLPSLGVDVVPVAWREHCHFRWNDAQMVSESEMARGMKERADQWRALGSALREHTRPGESIILGNIGAIGYESELTIFDLFGLVSPEVVRADEPLVAASPGHDRRVGPEFFYDRKPTYLNAYLGNSATRDREVLPPAWSQLIARGAVRLERITLEPGLGVPAGTELVLLRFVWGS